MVWNWNYLEYGWLRSIFTWLASVFISMLVRIIVFLIMHLKILLNSNHCLYFFAFVEPYFGYSSCEMKLLALLELYIQFFEELMEFLCSEQFLKARC